jgi:hypothetical protein
MSTGLIDAILGKMPRMNMWRKDFLRHAIRLFLCMRGKHNFENMGRYGSYDECSYRLNFEKPFDFALFNRELIQGTCGPERIAAFDPSYLANSGKHTPGVGWHWSGSAGKAKWGLEIGGLAVVDIANNTAMHLLSKQTPDAAWLKDEGVGLLEHYADVVCCASGHLLELSVRHLAVDAYFAKRPSLTWCWRAATCTSSQGSVTTWCCATATRDPARRARGTVKRSWGYYYTLMKGKEKVADEFALIFTCYNMRRAMTILTIPVLLEKMRGAGSLFLSVFEGFMGFIVNCFYWERRLLLFCSG